MEDRNYERPMLIQLDTGYNSASGSCKTGGTNSCGAGTGIGSTGGGQCLSGQYAGTCNPTGTSVAVWSCKGGSGAQNCLSNGLWANPSCTNGFIASTCGTGTFT